MRGTQIAADVVPASPASLASNVTMQISDTPTLLQHGAKPVFDANTPPPTPDSAPPSPMGISIGSFLITASQSPILTEANANALAATLKTLSNGLRIPPPEQTYGGSHLTIELEHGGAVILTLSINAVDALQDWARAHNSMTAKNTGVSVVKSVDAQAWSKKDTADWSGDAIVTAPDMIYDWTYCSPYSATFTMSPHTHPDRIPSWEPTPSSNFDMSLLTDRTAPILMFASINLYEDDMHDNGDVKLSVKVRVMPKCLFVLSRLFLRVDGVFVTVRDTRLFHVFGSKAVFMDTSWRHVKWGDLKAIGLPTDVATWCDEEKVNGFVGKLPLVKDELLPEGVWPHAVLQLPEVHEPNLKP